MLSHFNPHNNSKVVQVVNSWDWNVDVSDVQALFIPLRYTALVTGCITLGKMLNNCGVQLPHL